MRRIDLGHDASVQGATVSRCAEMRKLSYAQCIDRGLNWPLEIWARIDRFLDVTRALKAGVWRWQWRLGHGDRASLCFCGVSMPVQARRYIDAHIHPITLQFLLCLEQLFTKCFVRKHHAQLHAVRNTFERSSNSHKPPLEDHSWLTPSKPKTNMFHALPSLGWLTLVKPHPTFFVRFTSQLAGCTVTPTCACRVPAPHVGGATAVGLVTRLV
jgi:hypothetical protein